MRVLMYYTGGFDLKMNSSVNVIVIIKDVNSKVPTGKCWEVSFELINFLQYIFELDQDLAPTIFDMIVHPFILISEQEVTFSDRSY
jgi:hypothetical protein